MIYPILPDTDPILHSPVAPFDFENPPVDPHELANDLRETMLANGAFGLAANQCGLPYRVFVLESPEGHHPIAIFNPEIIESTGEVEGREGCLTYPRLILNVKRAAVVTVRGQTEHGEDAEITLAGQHARGAQHETDHLNGITFVKRVSKLKLEMAKKKLRK